MLLDNSDNDIPPFETAYKYKNLLKKIFFIESLKKIIGLKNYEKLIHFFRYYGFYPIKYNIGAEIDFGSDNANNFFKQELKNCNFFLEYGSGASTILAVKLNKRFYSIEGDRDFFKFIKKKVKNNEVKYKSLGIVGFSCIPVMQKYNFTIKQISDNQKKRIKNYCSRILKDLENEKILPDLILVDGRFRVLTCLYLYVFLRNKNLKFKVILDDYPYRENYHIIKKFFHIESVGRLVVAEKLKEIKEEDLNSFIDNDKYYFDWQ